MPFCNADTHIEFCCKSVEQTVVKVRNYRGKVVALYLKFNSVYTPMELVGSDGKLINFMGCASKKMIRGTEYGGVYSINKLLVEYTELKSNVQTEAEAFEDYLGNITSKNGTCE